MYLKSVADGINIIVSALIFVWCLGLLGSSWLFASESMLTRKTGSRREFTSAGWSLFLWMVWWFSLLLVYILLSGLKDDNFSPLVLFLFLLFNDFGNLAVLASSVAYCRGDAFQKRHLLPFVLAGLAIPSLAAVVTMFIAGPTGKLLAIAPSAVVSTAAMIAMGWSILVRCGWGTSPFLGVTTIYACLQVPAYISAMVLPASVEQGSFPHLFWIFYILAFFKVLLGLAFLGYFLSPDHRLEALSEEKAWPSTDPGIRMHTAYKALLKYGLGVLGSLSLGLLTAAFSPTIAPFIRNFVHR